MTRNQADNASNKALRRAVAPNYRDRRARAPGVIPPPSAPVAADVLSAMATTVRAAVTPGPRPVAPAFTHAINVNLPGWRALDQGRPGTCVAFGVAACVEHLEYRAGRPVPNFSEQFLYWAMKHETDDQDDYSYKTKLLYADQALQRVGICDNSLLPYSLRLVTSPDQPVSGSRPSAAAFNDAKKHRHAATFYVDRPSAGQPIPDAAATVWHRLALQRPVLICVPTFSRPGSLEPNNWDNLGLAAAYGIVADPKTAGYTEETGSHCVCVTGFDPGTHGKSKGRFIIRNSWGTGDWGQHGGEPNDYPAIQQRGYGSISVEHVEEYCWEMMQL